MSDLFELLNESRSRSNSFDQSLIQPVTHLTSPKDLGEEQLHILPRAFVRPLVVFRAFHAAIGVPVGEAVHGAAIFDELPVHTGVAQLVFKGRDIFGGHERIVRAMQREHLASNVFPVLGPGRIQRAVKTDDARDLCAAAGQFNDRRPAETIADGGDAFGSTNRCWRNVSNPALTRARSSVRSLLYLPACALASAVSLGRTPLP